MRWLPLGHFLPFSSFHSSQPTTLPTSSYASNRLIRRFFLLSSGIPGSTHDCLCLTDWTLFVVSFHGRRFRFTRLNIVEDEEVPSTQVQITSSPPPVQRRLKSQKWLEDAIKYKLTFPQICSSNGSKHWTSSTGMQHDRHRLGSVCGILFNQCYLLKQSTTSAESSSSTPVINGCNVNTVACGIPGQVSWLVACVFSILVAVHLYAHMEISLRLCATLWSPRPLSSFLGFGSIRVARFKK